MMHNRYALWITAVRSTIPTMGLFGSKDTEELRDPPLLLFPVKLDKLPTGEVYTGNRRLPRIGEVLGMDEYAIRSANRIIKSINHASAFERYNSRETRAFIFAGPPGSGKSLLTAAIARETVDNTYVYRLNPAKLANPQTGGLRKNLDIAFRQIANIATAQSEEDTSSHRRFSLRKPGEKKTILVIMDEFEALALKKIDGRVELDYDQFGAVNDLLTRFDDLQTETRNVVFLFTTNYPELMEEAVLDRAELVRFHQPDLTARKHMIIQHLSNKMYLMDDDVKIFTPELVDAIRTYREASNALSDAIKKGNVHDIQEAKKALGKIYTHEVEEILGPALRASEGFSGRDIRRAIHGMIEEWISQKIEVQDRNKGKIIRRVQGPGLIGRERLLIAMNDRALQKHTEETGASLTDTALEEGI